MRRTASRLHEALSGHTLVRAELRWPDLGGIDLAGRLVTEVTAYGKHILIRLAAEPTPGVVGDSSVRHGRDDPGSRQDGCRATESGVATDPQLPTALAVPRMPTAPAGPLTLHTHLRMDGEWFVHATGSRPWPSQQAVRAVLAGPEWTAVGHQLGMLDLVADEAAVLGHLGPDVMAADFADAPWAPVSHSSSGSASASASAVAGDPTGRQVAIARLTADPDRPVGEALMDQTALAGIGTFYMAETLYQLRVSPWTPVGAGGGATGNSDSVGCGAIDIGAFDIGTVVDTARRLLLRGVNQPIPNTTGDPRRGEGQYVHARSGRPCRRCGATVRVATIGRPPQDRPAFYCPSCQPGPTPTDDGRPSRPLGSGAHDPAQRRLSGLRRRR